jgi:hypothetical protein
MIGEDPFIFDMPEAHKFARDHLKPALFTPSATKYILGHGLHREACKHLLDGVLSKSEAGVEPRGPEGTTEGRDGRRRQHVD